MVLRVSGSLLVAFAIALAPEALAANAGAKECVASLDLGLESLPSGKLLDARKQFSLCAASTCPAEIRQECERQLDKVQPRIPTIVLAPTDHDGHDVAAVSITVDGRQLTSTFTGAAIELDPGEHRFSFTMSGAPPLTQSFVLREGEKGRREHVAFAAAKEEARTSAPLAAAKAPPSADAALDRSPPRATHSSSPLKITGAVLSGIGLVGIAIASVEGAIAISASQDQKRLCSGGTCGDNFAAAQADHTRAGDSAVLSNWAFIAGGALAATGAALFLLAPSRETPTAISLAPAWAPGSFGLQARGAF